MITRPRCGRRRARSRSPSGRQKKHLQSNTKPLASHTDQRKPATENWPPPTLSTNAQCLHRSLWRKPVTWSRRLTSSKEQVAAQANICSASRIRKIAPPLRFVFCIPSKACYTTVV
jgi:hypothetical protein